ncbi:MAG: hypothetical protein WEB50_14935 [Vicinamibacterales bacterium]
MTPTEHRPPQPAGHHDDEHLYDQEELHNEDVAHEHSDVNVRAILGFAGGLALVTALLAVAMYGLITFFERQAVRNEPVTSPLARPAGQEPPQPRLLLDEPRNLQEFRDSLAERLKGIDAGKKQLLEQGIPTRADAPTDPSLGTRTPSRGESSGGRAIPMKPKGNNQ